MNVVGGQKFVIVLNEFLFTAYFHCLNIFIIT